MLENWEISDSLNNRTLDALKKNKNITMLTLEQLCKILDCTPNDVIDFKDWQPSVSSGGCCFSISLPWGNSIRTLYGRPQCIYMPSNKFIVGIQWHPEFFYEAYEAYELKQKADKRFRYGYLIYILTEHSGIFWPVCFIEVDISVAIGFPSDSTKRGTLGTL